MGGATVTLPVSGGRPFIEIALRGDHPSGVTADGVIFCWDSKGDS